MGKKRNLQSHGRHSKVYVPIIKHLFEKKHTTGDSYFDFSLDDVREAASALGIVVRNAADVIYRMRSRTKLPDEILQQGFYILRQVGRGKYRMEQAESTIINLPRTIPVETIDTTPLPVRRLLPEDLSQIDEQGLLTIINYCGLLNHFTGLTVYRLRSHVRKSVANIGQAEVDEVDVGVAMRDDENPVIFPIEAKAADEAVNRVQISTMVTFCLEFFPGNEIRPIAIKLDYDSVIHFIEFNTTEIPAELSVVHAASYKLNLSERQLSLIKTTKVKL